MHACRGAATTSLPCSTITTCATMLTRKSCFHDVHSTARCGRLAASCAIMHSKKKSNKTTQNLKQHQTFTLRLTQRHSLLIGHVGTHQDLLRRFQGHQHPCCAEMNPTTASAAPLSRVAAGNYHGSHHTFAQQHLMEWVVRETCTD